MSEPTLSDAEAALGGVQKTAERVQEQLGFVENSLVATLAVVREAKHDNRETLQGIFNLRRICKRMRENPGKTAGGGAACLILVLAGFGPAGLKPKEEPSEPPPVTTPFEQSLEKGMAAQRARNYKAAIMHYDAALSVQPKSLTAMGEKAYAYFSLDRIDDADAVCDQMLTVNPRAARAHYIKGLIRKKQGMLPQALEHFRLAAHYGDPPAIHQIRIVEEMMQPKKTVTTG